MSTEHGLEELQQLFIDNSRNTRTESGIPDHFPTDPQAEVLIFDLIDLSYMKRIIFSDDSIVRKYKGNTPTPVSLDSRFFKPRMDFRFWRKQNG